MMELWARPHDKIQVLVAQRDPVQAQSINRHQRGHRAHLRQSCRHNTKGNDRVLPLQTRPRQLHGTGTDPFDDLTPAIDLMDLERPAPPMDSLVVGK